MDSGTGARIELRMTKILGVCELMLEDVYGALTEDQRWAIANLQKAAQEVRDLVLGNTSRDANA